MGKEEELDENKVPDHLGQYEGKKEEGKSKCLNFLKINLK